MRARRTDTTHVSIATAIRDVLRLPVKSLHAAGDGIEDLLVAVRIWVGQRKVPTWLFVECKTPRNKSGMVQESQYTKAQKEWRAYTDGWPRISATSAQDAIDQIRAFTLKDHGEEPF